MKKVKWIVGIVAVLLLGGGATMLYRIDELARLAVEKGATYALGVETTLGRMDIGIFGGRASLSELNVQNPEGFGSPHFLKLDEGSVAVSLGTLLEDKVVIPELALVGIDMSLERKGGKSNYQTILDSLKRFDTKTPKAKEVEGGRKFVVNKVTLDDVTVQVDLLSLGGGLTRVPIRINRIELTDVGSHSMEGIALAEVMGIITKAILSSVVTNAGGLIPQDIAGELKKGLEDLGGLGDVTIKIVGDVTTVLDGSVRVVGEVLGELNKGAIEVGKGVERVGESLQDGVEDIGMNIGDGLSKLFNPKKTKKDKTDDDDR